MVRQGKFQFEMDMAVIVGGGRKKRDDPLDFQGDVSKMFGMIQANVTLAIDRQCI